MTEPSYNHSGRPLYVEEDFYGYHIASPDQPERILDGDAAWAPYKNMWLESPDEIRIKAGTQLILEAADLIEIRASRVDFVHLPGVGSDTAGAAGDEPLPQSHHERSTGGGRFAGNI